MLGVKDGEEFCKLYGATDRGNFEGYNILKLIDGSLESINDPRISGTLDDYGDYNRGGIGGELLMESAQRIGVGSISVTSATTNAKKPFH